MMFWFEVEDDVLENLTQTTLLIQDINTQTNVSSRFILHRFCMNDEHQSFVKDYCVIIDVKLEREKLYTCSRDKAHK